MTNFKTAHYCQSLLAMLYLPYRGGIGMDNKDIVIDNNDGKDNIKVVLNSQNSQAIRELMDKV